MKTGTEWLAMLLVIAGCARRLPEVRLV